jgi:hypothetical protein
VGTDATFNFTGHRHVPLAAQDRTLPKFHRSRKRPVRAAIGPSLSCRASPGACPLSGEHRMGRSCTGTTFGRADFDPQRTFGRALSCKALGHNSSTLADLLDHLVSHVSTRRVCSATSLPHKFSSTTISRSIGPKLAITRSLKCGCPTMPREFLPPIARTMAACHSRGRSALHAAASGGVFRKLAAQKESRIEEGHLLADHMPEIRRVQTRPHASPPNIE